MADTKIIAATLEVFQECKVRSFPVDCCSLLRHYGYKVYTYKELKMKNNELYEMCMGYSDDAFQDGCTGIIAYNQDKPAGRSRFSLMHELGHHVFAHVGNSARNEREANAFASNLLAPRIAIHYAHCHSASDVAHIFELSYEAASNAFADYQKWHARVARYSMTTLDQQMYQHFYHSSARRFVWNIRRCPSCGKALYNRQECGCQLTALPEYIPAFGTEDAWDRDSDRQFKGALNRWLYGE